MQNMISKYFKATKPAQSSSTAAPPVDLCSSDDERCSRTSGEPVSKIARIDSSFSVGPTASVQQLSQSQSPIRFDLKEDSLARSNLARAVVSAFEQDDADTRTDSHLEPVKTKYTPLEQQVMDIRANYPDSLLMVECGYRMRFFGDDATVAAKILSIYAHRDHNFMVASIPTFRTYVHCKRLVNAGYKVAVVRQTETAALRKASKATKVGTKSSAAKGGPSNITFSRAVAGIFTPGTLVDENEPAFQDLGQSSRAAAADGGGEGDSRDDEEDSSREEAGGAVGGDAASAVGVPISAPSTDGEVRDGDAWIAAANEHVVPSSGGQGEDTEYGVAAVSIYAHRVQCRRFAGANAAADLADYLDLLMPRELLYGDTASADLVLILRSAVESTSRRTQTEGRIAAVPAMQFILSQLPLDSAYAWIHREPTVVQSAVFALHQHLQALQLEGALQDPEVHNPNSTISTDKASAPPLARSATSQRYFELDAVTARDLEIFQCNTSSSGTRQSNLWNTFDSGSHRKETASCTLFDVLNHCKTPFGRRTLQQWVMQPLCDVALIRERQSAVLWLSQATERMGKYNTSNAATWAFNLTNALAACTELESLLTALQHGRITPRRLLKLYKCVEVLGPINTHHSCYSSSFDDLPALVAMSVRGIPFVVLREAAAQCAGKIDSVKAEQGVVIDIFESAAEQEFPRLCALRRALADTEGELQAELVNIRVVLKQPTLEYRTLRTGPVSSIEHLIELPVGSTQRVPADWIKTHCTKLVNRYHTPTVLALQDRLYQLRDEMKYASREAWQAYVMQVKNALHTPLRRTATVLGALDSLLSLSRLCKLPGFVEPVYEDCNTDELVISGGRHPMVERSLDSRGEQFIPNDVLLRCKYKPRSCLVVTGPNMGGKSSFVRMVALICLLGQIGAHVPADAAKLCIFDHIFTRMGAGDDLAAGHSTFMSELYRTNYILQRASPRSLVILDELGRGTATNDGLAIAQATLGYVLRRLGSAMLFVTHFPQIADLVENAGVVPTSPGDEEGAAGNPIPEGSAVNVHMGYVQEGEGADRHVVFLYKTVEGPSEGSYGLNVARLAGIPETVLARAARNADWMRAHRLQLSLPQLHTGRTESTGGHGDPSAKFLATS